MIPGLGRCPAGGHGNPLQYSSLEKPHGQRSLAGCSPWGHRELDTTERLGTAQHLPGKCCHGSRCAPDLPFCPYAPLLAAPTWGQAGIRPDKLVLDQRSQARRCSVSVTIIQLGAAKFLVQEDAPECPGPVCLIQASHAFFGLHHQVAPPGLSWLSHLELRHPDHFLLHLGTSILPGLCWPDFCSCPFVPQMSASHLLPRTPGATPSLP